MIAITPIEIDQTASSGVWSFNTPKFSGADLRQIIIVPTSESTTYNLTITDEYDNVVLDRPSLTGTLNELLYLPLRGVYTVAVDTASADENFTGRLLVEE